MRLRFLPDVNMDFLLHEYNFKINNKQQCKDYSDHTSAFPDNIIRKDDSH